MAVSGDKAPLLKEDLVDPVGFLPEGSEALAKYIEEDLENDSIPGQEGQTVANLTKEDRAAKYFLKAAEKGKLGLVSKMLEGDKSLVRVEDSDGYTALHRASYNGHVEVARFLLQKGADTSAKTENGWQPLHCACRWDKTNVASILLQNGADINAQTNGGQTPLHLATTHCQEASLMELLLMNKNLDTALLNCQNQSAVDIAIRNGKHLLIFEVVEPSVNVQW